MITLWLFAAIAAVWTTTAEAFADYRYVTNGCADPFQYSLSQNVSEGCHVFNSTFLNSYWQQGTGPSYSSFAVNCATGGNIELFQTFDCSGQPTISMDSFCLSEINLYNSSQERDVLFGCMQSSAFNPPPAYDFFGECNFTGGTPFQQMQDHVCVPLDFQYGNQSFGSMKGDCGQQSFSFYTSTQCDGAPGSTVNGQSTLCLDQNNNSIGIMCRAMQSPPAFRVFNESCSQSGTFYDSPETCLGGPEVNITYMGTTYHSVQSTCNMPEGDGFRLFATMDCTGSYSFSLPKQGGCLDVVFNSSGVLEYQNLFIQCLDIPSTPPPPTYLLYFYDDIVGNATNNAMCSGNFIDLRTGQDGCLSGLDTDFFWQSGSQIYYSAMIDCNYQNPGYTGIRLFSNFDCSGVSTNSSVDSCSVVNVTNPVYGYSSLLSVRALCNVPPPQQPITYEFDFLEGPATSTNSSNPLGVCLGNVNYSPRMGYDGCISTANEGYVFQYGGQEFFSVLVECSPTNGSANGITLFSGSDCTGDSLTSQAWCLVANETSPISMTSSLVNVRASCYSPPTVPRTTLNLTFYINETTNEVGTCPLARTTANSASFDIDGCHSGQGLPRFYSSDGNETYLSYKIQCDPSFGPSRGIQFFYNEDCTGAGPPLALSRCLYTNISSPQIDQNSLRSVYMICSEMNPGFDPNATLGIGSCSDPRNASTLVASVTNGCQLATQGGGTNFGYNGTLYGSMSVNCSRTGEAGSGFRFFSNLNCTGSSSELFDETCMSVVNTLGGSNQSVYAYCFKDPIPTLAPTVFEGAYQLGGQCNGLSPSDSGVLSTGCRPVPGQGSTVEFQGTNWTYIKSDCLNSGQIAFFNDETCSGSGSNSFSAQCVSQVFQGANQTNRVDAFYFCTRPTTSPPPPTYLLYFYDDIVGNATNNPTCSGNFIDVRTGQDGCLSGLDTDFFWQSGSQIYYSAMIDCNYQNPGYTGIRLFSNFDCSGVSTNSSVDSCSVVNVTNPVYGYSSLLSVRALCNVPPPQQPLTYEFAFLEGPATSTNSSNPLGVCLGNVNYSRVGYDGCISTANEGYVFQFAGQEFFSVLVECGPTNGSANGITLFSGSDCTGNSLTSQAWCLVANATSPISMSSSLVNVRASCYSPPIAPRTTLNLTYYINETTNEVGTCPLARTTANSSAFDIDGCRSGQGLPRFYSSDGNETYLSYKIQCDPSFGPSRGIQFFFNEDCTGAGPPSSLSKCLYTNISAPQIDQNSLRSVYMICSEMNPGFDPNATLGIGSCSDPRNASTLVASVTNGCQLATQGGGTNFGYNGTLYGSMSVNCSRTGEAGSGFRFFSNLNCTGSSSELFDETCMSVVNTLGGSNQSVYAYCFKDPIPTLAPTVFEGAYQLGGQCNGLSPSDSGVLSTGCRPVPGQGSTVEFQGTNWTYIKSDCLNSGRIAFFNDPTCSGSGSTNFTAQCVSQFFQGANQTNHVDAFYFCTRPTKSPTTRAPSLPTRAPTGKPTNQPTFKPTEQPTPANTSSPTTAKPTRTPTTKPSTAPSNTPSMAPTGRVPQVSSVQLASDLTSVIVDFDYDTNQRNNPARALCSPWLQLIASDTGCVGGQACPVFCVWTSPRRLSIELNSLSDFILPGELVVRFSNSSGIRNAYAVSGQVNGAFDVFVNQSSLVSPSVALTGPSTVSLCGGSLAVLSSTVSGTGGRTPKYEWFLNGTLIPGQNRSRLTLSPPGSEGTALYALQITSFAGRVTLSATFAVAFTSTARPQVIVPGPSSVVVEANGRIDLTSSVNLPAACLAVGGNFSSAVYKYNWTIFGPGDSIVKPSSVVLNSSRLLISPASLLTPGVAYRVELMVNPGLVGILPGFTSLTLNVTLSPMVSRARASISSLVAATPLTVDAAQSCNPNRASPPCTAAAGQTRRDLTGLTFNWFCTNSAGDCSTLCTNRTASECLVQPNTLSDSLSPYSFQVNASSDGLWALSPVVVVNILPNPPPACILPTVSMLPFPSKINVGESGAAALQATVFNFTEDIVAGNVLHWLDVTIPTAPSSVARYVGPQGSTSRPNLVILFSSLSPGSTYSFRLVAVVNCTGGMNAFGEISFTTNAPPRGGVLSASSLSGRAGLDDFSFSVDGAEDEDLPLQFSFEYRTDFSATSGDTSYLTLSSFTSSNSIKTRFTKADRIQVMARIRDAFGATTARSASPLVDNIAATQLPISAESLPFNASTQVSNLKGGGGSVEDTLRVASALAAASSVTGGSASAEVVAWQQETQSVLLDAILSTAIADPDPSYVMLQASSLSTVLASAASVQDISTPAGQAFLTSATSFVGDLLASAKNAILAQATDADDPLLSQYRPPQLGDVTVANLLSILDAIRSSSLAARRRLADHSPSERQRRSLAMETTTKNVVGSVRDNLRSLADALLLGAVSGSVPQEVKGVEMQVVTATEIASRIGVGSGLKSITLPAFDALDPPTVFSLPPNVVAPFGFGDAELVRIIAVRFRFNVRELAGTINFPNYTLDENAPVNNSVSEIIALDFQRNASDGVLHPFNLSTGISLRIPVAYYAPDNTTKPACGFYNETLDIWSSSGCNVTEFKLAESPSDTSGYIVCECSHASDYASWQAFLKDVNSVFDPVDASNLSTIAAAVLGGILPAMALLWLASQRLAVWMDSRDVDLVHYGAFVALTRRKLELHDRQRRFFKFLRANQGPVAHTDIIRYKREAEEREQAERDTKIRVQVTSLVRRVVILIGVGSTVTAILLFAGAFVSTFISASPESLVDTLGPAAQRSETFGLVIASAIIYLFCGLAVLEAFVNREGKFAEIGQASTRFILLVGFEAAAAAGGIAAFSLGIQNKGLSGLGPGLALVTTGACVGFVCFVFTFLAFFVNQHGPKSRRLGMEFVRNIARGLMYEQTLVSAFTRFDPFYDRQKRFSIVIAVILGNLFACSVFFSLRRGEGVSFGLVLASTFISSLIVAVPVKIALRLLFRLTRSRAGSKMDRIAGIFRIIAFSSDVSPAFANEAEKRDVEMLTCFRRFYLAKTNLRILERAIKSTKAPKDDAVAQDKRKQLLKMFSKREGDGFAPADQQKPNWTNRQTGEFVLVPDAEKAGSLDTMDVREIIATSTITPEIIVLAKAQLAAARNQLKDALDRSHKAWEKEDKLKWSARTRKQLVVQRERNTLVKLAVALAEEPHARPKVYEAMLPSWYATIAWGILLGYFLGCILWICFWIFSRNGQSRDQLVAAGDPSPTEAEIAAQTNAYLLAWLGTSFFGVFLTYFVFEPILVVLRYAVLPLCIKTLRPERDDVEDDSDVALGHETALVAVEDPEAQGDQAEEDGEQKPSMCTRILCCGCWGDQQRVKGMEKRAGDALIVIVDALV